MSITRSAKRTSAVPVPSLTLLAVMVSSAVSAQQGADLPRIIGTELPGTSQWVPDISIDGNPISVLGNDYGGFIPDVDGDGIVEAYLNAVEPGESCSTLVYLPSRQARSAHLQSDDLDSYTRVRNFDNRVFDDSGNELCDSTYRNMSLTVVGDLTGDGVVELITSGSANSSDEIIFSGALPHGTLIEPGNLLAGQMSLLDHNVGLEPIGDFDGDGKADWYMSLFDEQLAAGEGNELGCSIHASPETLPARVDFSSLEDGHRLANFSRNDYGNCPAVKAIGDVNGDGMDDIAINTKSDSDTYVVHGKAGRMLDDDLADAGYRIPGIHTGGLQRAMDFDADGYDDVLMPAYAADTNRLLSGAGTLIAYGGPEGLVKAGDLATRNNGVVTQLVHKFEKPMWRSASGWSVVSAPQSVGDINDDGADDLLIVNYAHPFNTDFESSKRQNYSIIYGTPGVRFPVLLEASVDGGNGVYWSEENSYFSSVILGGDLTGDGIDDLAYNDRVIPGASRLRLATEPQFVHLLDGPDSLDIFWGSPADNSSHSGYRIVSNGKTVAERGTDTSWYRLDRVAGEPITELRIQSIDAAGNVNGEIIRHPDLTEVEYSTILGDFQDAEYNARGSIETAETYTLTGKSYGPELGELFWNVSKRFVLIWRDGEVIDRVEGNSYMVHGGGEFFITTDYAGSLPDDGNPSLFASGTLRRSNVVSINESDVDAPVEPPVSGSTPPMPANLYESIYSTTAAELFWDRAPLGDNVVSYEIDRNGVRVATTTGISYFDATRQPGQEYTYSVVAVDRSGRRSEPAIVGEDGGDTDEPVESASLPLDGLVYSSTALELFWNADDLEGANALRFEVFQNGQSVSESSARSYFTKSLAAGTRYRFELVARNAQGVEVARSEELVLTTRPL